MCNHKPRRTTISRNGEAVSGVVMDYLNSSRGKAIEAIFKSLEATADLETRWQWIEKMSHKPSDVLRLGGLDALLSIAHHDVPRAMQLFAALCNGHQGVLRTQHAHQLLSWAIYKQPILCRPFIDDLLGDSLDSMKRTGAEMATILAMRSENVDDALLNQLKTGPKSWQEGLVSVASSSVTLSLHADIIGACETVLRWAFVQTDNELRRSAARFTYQLKEEHLDTLRSLLEDFVASPAYGRGDDGFHEFLLRYGELEPEWTLTQIETVLQKPEVATDGFRHSGHDELSRCVLRLYNMAPSKTKAGQLLRARAMDVFGELLEKSPFDSDQVLREWDEGHDGRFL